MASKQKFLAVASLLGGAMVWGLIWYPYRVFLSAGVSAELSTFLTYGIALGFGLLVTGPVWRELKAAPGWGILLMLCAGWTNYGYVLAILNGEVMRVLLLFYLAPLWTVIFAYFILGEKLNRYGYAIAALSFAGAMAMLWRPGLGAPMPACAAEWIGLTAGMGFAMLNVLVRKTQHLSVNFKSASVWMGTVLLAGGSLAARGDLFHAVAAIPAGTWGLLVLVGVVLAATSLIVQFGLTYLPANRSIVLFLSELVFAAVSSYFLAGEALSPPELVGALLIVSASLVSGRMHAGDGATG